MFGSVTYGAITALGWGSADFIARFTGRELGYRTVILARVFLREAMNWKQWGGVCAIVGGVGLLSLYG